MENALKNGNTIVNTFNKNEFIDISRRFGRNAWIKDLVFENVNTSYFNKIKTSVKRDRRGEVVFCVIRPNGKIITVSCSEYPKGIFRIPTGGIHKNEDIVQALYREVLEELGLKVEITEFAGVLRIRFKNGKETVPFYSYVFILLEKSGRLLKDAIDDEISEVMEVDVEGLAQTAKKLESITGKWSDWGRFRGSTTKAVYEHLSLKPPRV
jgi:8-oxo-dGTP diphosphatase